MRSGKSRSTKHLPPGLYSICDGCEEPVLGELLTPVTRPHPIYKHTMDTGWFCPVCRRNMVRIEQGEPS